MEQLSTLGNDLHSRTISAFPISIGTSLAFESLFAPRLNPYDPSRPIPEKVDLSKYPEIWINIYTLFRNISGAITREAFLNSSEAELKDTIDFEIDVINSLFSNEGNNFCKPKYYFCSYDKLFKNTNSAVKFRTDKTDFQKIFKYKYLKTVESLNKSTDEYFKLDSEIKPANKISSLILTHIPYDLTSYKHFSNLTLLESHSGKIKQRNQWNSKYYPVPGEANLSNMPFYRKLLLVFGDKVLIHPADIRLRRLIIDSSIKRNWTVMTTLEKIMLDLSIDIKEQFVLKFLQDL